MTADFRLPTPTVRVVVRRGGQVISSAEFTQADILVGRSPRSDVVLDDALVSWTHALIHVDWQDGVAITDRSSNGTFHEGSAFRQMVLGAHGTVTVAPFDVTFDANIAAAGEAPYTETQLSVDVPVITGDGPKTGGPRGPDTRRSAARVDPQIGGRLLRFDQGPGRLAGTVYELPPKTLTVGRAADCDIPLEPRSVSRYHATLTPLGNGRWRVRDSGSQNGIQVNDVTIMEREVGPGDRIAFGTEVSAVIERATTGGDADLPAVEDGPPSPASTLDALTIRHAPSTLDSQIAVVQVVGRVDGYSYSYLRDELAQVIDGGSVRVIVDFSRCTYCDHEGLGVLVTTQARLRSKKGAICPIGLDSKLKDAFRLLRLEQLLPAEADETAAVRRLAKLTGR